MHTGIILPLEAQDRDFWEFIQQESDKVDQKILSEIVRTVPVQEGKQVKEIQVKKGAGFIFPKPTRFTLSNGLNVLYYHNPNVPKIDVALELKAKHYYDPKDLLGLNAFMDAMMLEGTKKHTGPKLADAIESEGISLRISPGFIGLSTLKNDLEKGLNFLHEIFTESTFEEPAIEKIRTQMTAELKNFWDEPLQFCNLLATQKVYKDHPYGKSARGTFETIAKIRHEDLINCYKSNITPQGTTISLVGDLQSYDIKKILEKTLGAWQGNVVADLDYPTLEPVSYEEIKYPMQRDQIVLCYAGLSINRSNPDFDKVLLFDQVFTGGSLGSMSSRLFELREQSGLFYTISGSLLSHADEQPGMVLIKTIVSLDRLAEAEQAIEETITIATHSMYDNELEEAKNALSYSLVDNFASNRGITSAFLFLQRYGLSDNFFDTRAQMLERITKEEVLNASKKLLDTKKLVKIKIGRV
jgi:zinc protease